MSEVIAGASQSSNGQHIVSLLQKVTAAKIVSSSPPIVRTNKFFSFSCKKQVSEESTEINNISVPPIVNDSPSTEALNSVPVIASETKQNCELLTNTKNVTPPVVSQTGLSSNPPQPSVTRANPFHFTITSSSSESVTQIQSHSQPNELTNSTFQAQNILDLINNAESTESDNLPNTPCSSSDVPARTPDSYVTIPPSRAILKLIVHNCTSQPTSSLSRTPCNSPDIPDEPEDTFHDAAYLKILASLTSSHANAVPHENSTQEKTDNAESRNWTSPKPFTNISVPYLPYRVANQADQPSTSTQTLAIKKPKGILKPDDIFSYFTRKREAKKVKFSPEKQIRFFHKSAEEHLDDTGESPTSPDPDDESEGEEDQCSNLVDQWTAANTIANIGSTATAYPAACAHRGVVLNVANEGDGPEVTGPIPIQSNPNPIVESIPAINVIEKNSEDTSQSSSEVKIPAIPDKIEENLTSKSDSKSHSNSERKKEKKHKKSDSKAGDLKKKTIEKQNNSSEKKSNSGKQAKVESKSKSKESKSTKVSQNKLSSTHTSSVNLSSSKGIQKHKKTGETRKEKEPKVATSSSAFKMKLSKVSGTLSSSNEKNVSEKSENKTKGATNNEKGGGLPGTESDLKDKLQKEATSEKKEKCHDKLVIKGDENKEGTPTKTFKNIVGDFNAMKNSTQLLINKKAHNLPKMFEIKIATKTNDSLVPANIDSDKIIGASSSLNSNSCIVEPKPDDLNSANVSYSEINNCPSTFIIQGTSNVMPIVENNKKECISRHENSEEIKNNLTTTITAPTQLIFAEALNESLPIVTPRTENVTSCTKSVLVPKTLNQVPDPSLVKVKRPRGRPPKNPKVVQISLDTSLSDENLSISSPTPLKTPIPCSLSNPPSQQLELKDKQKSSCSTGNVFKISISEIDGISNQNLTVFNTETEQTITFNSVNIDSKQNLQSNIDSENIPTVKVRWEPQYYAQEIIEDNENTVLKIKESYKFCMDRIFSSYVNLGHRCDQGDQIVPPSSSKVNTESGSSLACHELTHVDNTEASPASPRQALCDAQDSETSECKDAAIDNVLLPPSQDLATPKPGRKRKESPSKSNQSPCPKQKKVESLNLPS